MTGRRWALVVAAVAAVAIVVVAVLQLTTAASAAYVALGDSYASGAGTSAGSAEENECRRSDEAHPNLLAAEVEALADLDFVACSGATTADLLAEQLPAVGADTQVVTMTIGGNDVGLTRSLRVCALTPESTDCTGAVAAAQDVIGKIFAIFFPVMAFVASGFEHNIANMYFMALGLLAKGDAATVAASHLDPGKLDAVSLGGYFHNLIPVTLGNIVGGALFVAVFYYLIFRKHLESLE